MDKEKQKDIKSFKVDEIASLPPEKLQPAIASLVSGIATRRNRNLLVMFYPETTNVSMSPPNISTIRSAIAKADRIEQLDLFIHSSGGDIHTAYKLAKLCQKRSKHVKALVPEYAKSAATLLALGCHELEMSPIAELGPLDPVILGEDGSQYPAFAIRISPKVLEKEIEECKNEDVRKLKAEFVVGPIAAK